MTDVEATQLRDSIRAGYESLCMDRMRACGNRWALPPQSLSINSVGYDPRREVAQKSLSLDLLRDASKLCRLPIESGPLWRGRRNCVGQPRDVGSPFPRQLDRPISGLETSDVPGKAGLISSGAHVRRTTEKRSAMQCQNIHSRLTTSEFLANRLNH